MGAPHGPVKLIDRINHHRNLKADTVIHRPYLENQNRALFILLKYLIFLVIEKREQKQVSDIAVC